QVMAMQLAHLVAGDAPQPEEERDLGPVEIRSQAPPGLEVGILEDVGGIDPSLEPLIQPEGDHPPQPRAAAVDQGLPAPAVARGGEPEELVVLARFLWHQGHPSRFAAAPRLAREDQHPPTMPPPKSSPARDERRRPRDR